MKQDPFGNLTDWGPVLDTFDELADSGRLAACQPGLIRILRFKGNWRLREEVLKRVGEIQTPSKEMVLQVVAILADDNTYYDARIIAGDALVQLLKNGPADSHEELTSAVRKLVDKLKSTPQPPFFDEALDRVHSEVGVAYPLEN
ncbi:MAG: hypothetical protein KFF68_14215 [Desulfosarcina sp.]|nr:hypothetical protein [Desulfosarcina sp.]